MCYFDVRYRFYFNLDYVYRKAPRVIISITITVIVIIIIVVIIIYSESYILWSYILFFLCELLVITFVLETAKTLGQAASFSRVTINRVTRDGPSPQHNTVLYTGHHNV